VAYRGGVAATSVGAWRARSAMPPDRWPGVGLRSTDEWAPCDRKIPDEKHSRNENT
jgi:hypothetical protein